ncbi:hypothetical protein HYALB_00000299 [Hymenoscyphus albidus]|uniref:chitinase n=1 Tax=Hymenoscyphus albidus TaxID=595503 RepID=A0A9N9LU53_9HELO|nr:hypothetical protein HYALB_00000299 [Hymenoscyphus albidus]
MNFFTVQILFLLSLLGLNVAQDEDYFCSKTKPCKVGCCGPLTLGDLGYCGYGPAYCGQGCTSSCGLKSECDGGNWGAQWSNASTCPLNVCCSRFGFCGTAQLFCGDKKVPTPECGGKSSDAKTIGYYEGWNLDKPCGTITPADIPLGYCTHINFAFALIDPKTFRIAPMDPNTASRYDAVTALKVRQFGLQVWIAIGGWAMNDPGPMRKSFSDLTKSAAAQNEFFESLITFMIKHDFDGVDIDWEYPVADDRGGVPEDFDNFPIFLERLRNRLNSSGRRFGLSITLPASYWYLRGFDIIKIEPSVDWFNIMTYDIHGIWDSSIKDLGPYARAHTNLTEINAGLELLWRNNINPGRVNLGLGFYGRSFTMKDPSCMSPGCGFSGPGKAGRCTGTSGVLSGLEIREIIASGATVKTDEAAAVKIVTWDTDQWVSWDDEETLKKKVEYVNKRCLGGTMIWAIDLDDGSSIDALGKGLGRPKANVTADLSGLPGSDLGTGPLNLTDQMLREL